MSKYRNRRSAGYRRKEQPELQWLENSINVVIVAGFTSAWLIVSGLSQIAWVLLNLSWIGVSGFIEWRTKQRAAALLTNTSVKPVFVPATVIQPKTLPVKMRRLRSAATCITLIAHKRLGLTIAAAGILNGDPLQLSLRSIS